MASSVTTTLKSLTPLKNTILVYEMEFKERISNGIILLNDDMTSQGIRPRWAKVYAIGPDVRDVEVGQYVMVAHGRWTRGLQIVDEEGSKTIRKIDNNDILLISDQPVHDMTMSDKVTG